MIKISKIKNGEINLFAADSKYVGWENIPISKYRAISYSQNPRSNPQDVVLYLAFHDDILVGYRTVMPDLVFVGETQIKVGWLSGNWVHPDFRRKGISTMLFNEVYKDWNNRLLYTNYAPESKAVYDKSGKFGLLASKNGRRFYLRSCLSTLLPSRSSIFRRSIPALKVFDFLINLFNPFPIIIRTKKFESSIDFEYLQFPDNEVFQLYENECKSTLTQRTQNELQWIFSYPWLVSSPMGDSIGERYFFSSNPKRFSQTIIKVFKNKVLLGFLMLNINDDKLSIPYCSNFLNFELITKLLLTHAVKLKVSMITLYEPNIVAFMNRQPLNWLLSKSRNQNYFATKELINQFDGKQVFFKDGDGDCAFI